MTGAAALPGRSPRHSALVVRSLVFDAAAVAAGPDFRGLHGLVEVVVHVAPVEGFGEALPNHDSELSAVLC